jgi:glycerol-3-phosphate acyltransferase PlsX
VVTRVVVDAMGGDYAPQATVEGAVRALRELGIPVTLVGRSDEVKAILTRLGIRDDRLAVVDAPEVVTMEEHAVAAVRRRARASITVAMTEAKDQPGAAVVSAGNSGAVTAAALFILGRLPGVDRPGIGALFPTLRRRPTLLIDVGAVADPRPQHLVQFAYLGTSYLRHVEGVENPRVGLLSNGSEPGKGNHLVREVHRLLAVAPGIDFVGNLEGNDIPLGVVDVIVCDGFTGNIALKTAEGIAALVKQTIRTELTRGWHTKILALGLRPTLLRTTRRLDYREYGGAPLLGVNGNVIIAHGRSDSTAIRNAIRTAYNAARRDLVGVLAREMHDLAASKK